MNGGFAQKMAEFEAEIVAKFRREHSVGMKTYFEDPEFPASDKSLYDVSQVLGAPLISLALTLCIRYVYAADAHLCVSVGPRGDPRLR